ncbi:DNA mismatch repair protein MutS [Hutsoniella sourekii]
MFRSERVDSLTKKKQTPMMEQYYEIKAKSPGAILFFRLGDFYEMFDEDARLAAEILEITLTTRNKNADNPIPMAGVPYHSASDYIRRLVEAGYKVAICEQMEDPKLTKGMVRRDIVKIITPGTIMEADALENKKNNYLAALRKGSSGQLFLTYIDVSTGDISMTSSSDARQIYSELQTISPSELLLDPDKIDDFDILQTILPQVYISKRAEENFSDSKSFTWQLEVASQDEAELLNYLFSYLESVQKQAINYVKPVIRYELDQYLQMNHYTKAQLELTQSLRTQRKKGSLLWFIDKTRTAMGGRLLHQWLDKPLLLEEPLNDRHQKVAALMDCYFERQELVDNLRNIYDLERLVSKISLGSANARELDQLRLSLSYLPRINQILTSINEAIAVDYFQTLPSFEKLYHLIDQALLDELPISITEGGLIRSGYNEDLDRYQDALNNGENWLAELQVREREKTGLKKLKIGFNKVFGYYIELSRLQAQQLDDQRYQRKQTLANSERFITEELKEMEAVILEASEKSVDLEYQLFVELRQEVSNFSSSLQQLAESIAELDVLASFASLSEEENYVRAEISQHPHEFSLEASRHPVIESLIGQANFVANDVDFSPEHYILLLTGPNMSGKSTYMRQVAYCVILNQIGCFVPAKKARLPLVDQIFTRIGSSDDISSGQSTFMVEMMETNTALKQATSRSLLLFDEIGRGTATYDGMALAEGIIHYLATQVKAITIFSTHYHELTDLESQIPSLKNIHVGAEEVEGHLVFLYKIISGPADKSYGLHVAKLAGLPDSLINYSAQVLEELESNATYLRHIPDLEQDQSDRDQEQLSLFNVSETNSSEAELLDEFKKINLNRLTPIEALNLMYEWQDKILD